MTGRSVESIEIYRRVLEQEPDSWDAKFGLARLEFQSGKSADAVETAEMLVEAKPQNSEARYLLGQCLQASGRSDEAKSHLEYVREAGAAMQRVQVLIDGLRRTDNLSSRVEIGRTLLKYGKTDDGIEWLRGAINMSPGNKPAHKELLNHYEQQGDDEMAAKHRQAISM